MMLGKTTAALLLGLGCGYAAATPAEAAPKCVLDPNAEYTGGNLFNKLTPNRTNSVDTCCQMCQETTGCVFWSLNPHGCWGNASVGCCWLKSAQAWPGRSNKAGMTSGSTRPLPVPPTPPPPSPPAADPSTTYNFLAIGDWGNDSPGQYATAAGMGVVAEEINATQVFCLGDNFYGSGIHTPADGVDGEKRFKKTFEDVYAAPALMDIPFYAIAGNHDHGGNVSAQIAYGSNGLHKTRWVYPDWYYNVTQTVQIPGGATATLEVLLFDSVVGLGNSDVVLEDGSYHELNGDELPGPSDPPAADKMFAWLEARMAASTADYLWVGAHYPVWSIASHGPTAGLVTKLRPLLEKHEANYFNGHDHDLEHIQEVGSKVNYVTTGSGMACCYADSNLAKVPKGSVRFAMVGGPGMGPTGSGWEPMPFEMKSGFTSYRIGAESMEVVFHAHNGTALYTTPAIMPRKKTPQPLTPLRM